MTPLNMNETTRRTSECFFLPDYKQKFQSHQQDDVSCAAVDVAIVFVPRIKRRQDRRKPTYTIRSYSKIAYMVLKEDISRSTDHIIKYGSRLI